MVSRAPFSVAGLRIDVLGFRPPKRERWRDSSVSCTVGFHARFLPLLSGVPLSCCPYDCNEQPNNIAGQVEATDFLALLNQWSQTGTSCDPDADGVDVVDFLGLLNAWGLCP